MGYPRCEQLEFMKISTAIIREIIKMEGITTIKEKEAFKIEGYIIIE